MGTLHRLYKYTFTLLFLCHISFCFTKVVLYLHRQYKDIIE